MPESPSRPSRQHQPRDYPHGAVVAVVYRESRFLVIKRSQYVKAPGKYCFAGGGVEPGETRQQAVAREMAEELGVQVNVHRHVWTGETPSGVELQFWQVSILPGEVIQPALEEVESFGWQTPAEMRSEPELLQSAIEFLDRWEAGEIKLDH